MQPARSPHADAPALAGALLTALAAAVYYGCVLGHGFLYSDDGNYAQVAYELHLGADPHDIRLGYGVLWFKIGEWLFALFGPSFRLVETFFYTVAGATAVLVFATLRRTTGSLALAMLGAVSVLLVPAFPPTVFYASSVALNVCCQVQAARRWRRLTPRDLAAPAAALALTFLVRPDFGFVFSVPLLLILAAHAAVARMGAVRTVAAALAVFVAVQLPLFMDGMSRGYADLIVDGYRRYPLLLWNMVVNSVGGGQAGSVAGAAEGAGAFLQRVPLSALWTAPPAQAALAFLTYAPVAVIALFALHVLAEALERMRHGAHATSERFDGASLDDDRLAMDLVVLVGALATLPHYFLFRPDLPHIANFMTGFAILAGTLLARLGGWAAGGGAGARTAAAAGGLAALGTLGVYLAVGLTQPGTGSIQVAQGRDQPFVARNGVDVLVTAEEAAHLGQLRDLVEANSNLGDRIVCLPFCPGVAFMTGRRMLLPEYYADDLFLLIDPGWTARIIERTQNERPPVVIVFDWALNGTEISRFSNWARPYIDVLDQLARERVPLGGGTAYLLRKHDHAFKPER
ncbi:hypothetical protein [Azospirillum doebereinerae]